MQKKETVKKSSRFSELWECINREIDFSIRSANNTLQLETSEMCSISECAQEHAPAVLDKIVKKSARNTRLFNLLKADNSEIIAGIEEARESIKEEVKEKKDNVSRIPDKFVEGIFGGYGFVPVQTADYGKLYSYLGTYKAKSSIYEGMKFILSKTTMLKQRSERIVLDSETRNTEYRRMKYFMPGMDMMSNAVSVFYNHGMSSEDYERFKIMRLIDPVMERLMMSIL